MAWVRRIQYFNYMYAFGLIMVVFTTLFTCTYTLKQKKDDAGFEAFDSKSFLDTFGFCFYSLFEGIGTLLPIMKETKRIKNFHNIVKSSFITLSVYYTAFGLICYHYFGDTILNANPIVLDNLPTKNI